VHVAPALQDLEPQQLLLFVQSFGIPVSSMSKLLQYLDQAVAQDPQALEQNIMDKSEPRALRGSQVAGSVCRREEGSWGSVRCAQESARYGVPWVVV
jgi:hypothetical protein